MMGWNRRSGDSPRPESESWPEYKYAGQSPYYGYPQPSMSRRRRRAMGRIVLIVLAGLAAAVGSAAVLMYPVEETNGIQASAQTHVVEPKTLAGRTKFVDAEFRAVADQMTADVKKETPEATDVFAAFYGEPGKRDLVMIVGVSAARITAHAAKAGKLIAGVAYGGVKVTDVKPVEPGPLGGAAKCGDADVDGMPSGVCTWADGNTMGLIFIYFKSGQQAEAEFVEMRSEIEQRS
ncbi:hypothetical protein [Microbispora sp. CA-102843]|uniref:hypothetical protein n=1 Tax=Microbispora sp. CA-102843 TaxID=3239952 RepID=UPI003D8DF6BC